MDWTEGIRYWSLKEDKYKLYLKYLWNPSTIQELRLGILNNLLPSTNNPSMFGDFEFLSDYEERCSVEAYNNKLTDYGPKSFKYHINQFGFRGKNQIVTKDRSIGFFGCSYTFGVGLPEDKLFSSIVSNELGLTGLNFGMPGASSSTIARLFNSITRFQKLDYAVVLLPHCTRLEYPIKNTYNEFELVNVINNFSGITTEQQIVSKKLKDTLSFEYMMYDTSRSISIIELAARSTDTKVFYSSWDKEVHDMISIYFSENKKVLPWFRVLEHSKDTKYKKSRDGSHPGDNSNKLFADCVVQHIKEF